MYQMQLSHVVVAMGICLLACLQVAPPAVEARHTGGLDSEPLDSEPLVTDATRPRHHLHHLQYRSLAATRMLRMHADDDVDPSVPVNPFIAHNAVVTAPASAEHQAQYIAGTAVAKPENGPGRASSHDTAARQLLHGPPRPFAYPVCNRCRVVSCAPAQSKCTGHCRRRRQLFECTTTFPSLGTCVPLSPEEQAEVPPSTLTDSTSLALTAEAPFIGCAVTAAGTLGCPPPGTPATYPGQTQEATITVTSSSCRTAPFTPACGSPFFPFGTCDCAVEVRIPGDDPVEITTPCTAEVVPEWAGGGPGQEDVVVEVQGDVIMTSIGGPPSDGVVPLSTRSVVVDTFQGDAAVTQDVFV